MIAGFIGVAVFAVIANPILWVPAAAGFTAAAFLLAVALATLTKRIIAACWSHAADAIEQDNDAQERLRLSDEDWAEITALLSNPGGGT